MNSSLQQRFSLPQYRLIEAGGCTGPEEQVRQSALAQNPANFPQGKKGHKAQKYTTPAAGTSAMPLSRSAAKAPIRPSPCNSPLVASSRTWNTATSNVKTNDL